MSYVIADPEMMTSAATDLATIGSDLSAAHRAAATPTVALIPAAADEVSAAVTHLFSQHAANYHATAAQAAAFNDQFVQHLKTGAGSYAGAEAAAAASLQPLTAPAATLPTFSDVSHLLSQLAANLALIPAILAELGVVVIFFGPILLYALLGLLLSPLADLLGYLK